MTRWPVSPELNRPGLRDDPGLLEPVPELVLESQSAPQQLTFNRD